MQDAALKRLAIGIFEGSNCRVGLCKRDVGKSLTLARGRDRNMYLANVLVLRQITKGFHIKKAKTCPVFRRAKHLLKYSTKVLIKCLGHKLSLSGFIMLKDGKVGLTMKSGKGAYLFYFAVLLKMRSELGLGSLEG